MKVVDQETRKEAHNRRLAALEADNYIEESFNDGDDNYDESDESENEKHSKKQKKISNKNKNDKYSKDFIQKWANKKQKSLERIIDEQQYILQPDHPDFVPNYLSACAAHSTFPARHFCSVCGNFSDYTCTRCGQRFCSIKCNNNHKETRCLKFSI